MIRANGKKLSVYVYLGLCILFWASIPVASKKILVELNNLQMLFYSTIDYLNMAFLGFLTYLHYVLLYGAFALTTAQEAFILNYTWPLIIMLLAFVILKEKINLKKIAAVLVGFFGIVVIITQGKFLHLAFTNISGNILALSGAFVFALFSIIGKKQGFDKTIAAFIYFSSALIFIAITVFIFSAMFIPSPKIWIWLVYNGIFINGITYVWWFKVLEGIDTSIVSTALYLTPFLSLVYIWLFLNEKILFSSIIGLIIIVAGILLQYFNRDYNENKKNENYYLKKIPACKAGIC